MTLLRLAAALALIALGAALGRRAGDRLRLTAEQLEALPADLLRLRSAMLEQRLPLAAARKTCRTRMLREGAADVSLPSEEAERFSTLISRLGQGSAAEQDLLLREAADAFTASARRARERHRTLGRLYVSLGALGGLALALCFI